ncbi:trypsin-like peptidase domain-containing protein [Kitasatospora viridis]|uniref:Trypsin-like peptidase n=1 Tax=Kitasatospora viridis TaxID=281105 RepID=A0A561SDY6_9ACTN|nr:trypsin-like peptidase domain-containing protein [Kitasatospora viridis]TWF73076.1 trypsin-like peptidase [Kitasatospora viridis]
MPNLIRHLLAAGATAVITVAGFAAPAAHADVAPHPIGGGSGIVQQLQQTANGWSAELCTLTAVGYDGAGNLVGLTNAHCFIDAAGHKLVGDKVYLDTTPPGTAANPASTSFDVNPTLAIGPIGTVTYVSTPNDYLTGGTPGLDYAVIKLDPSKVTPTATVSSPSGSTTINSIGPVSGFGTRMCKQGHRTGLTCGITLGQDGIWYTTLIWTLGGDSGSPVVNGTTLTGVAWGAQHFTPITSVLSDLNAQGGVGAGFHLAN